MSFLPRLKKVNINFGSLRINDSKKRMRQQMPMGGHQEMNEDSDQHEEMMLVSDDQ